jgi:hypothetical protein
MEPAHHLTFGPFCLDVTHSRLWRGEQPMALRPRSLAVLQYLAEHPGRLVTKAELRQQVGTHVTDIVLRVSIETRGPGDWRPPRTMWRRSDKRAIASRGELRCPSR